MAAILPAGSHPIDVPSNLDEARKVSVLIQLANIHLLTNALYLTCMKDYLDCMTQAKTAQKENVNVHATWLKRAAQANVIQILGAVGSLIALGKSENGREYSQGVNYAATGFTQMCSQLFSGAKATRAQHDVEAGRGAKEKQKEALQSMQQSRERERGEAAERQRSAASAYRTQD